MTAVNPEQFQQLSMFMRAGDMRKIDGGSTTFTGSEMDYDDTYPYDTWERKRKEANAPGTATSEYGAHPNPALDPRDSRYETPQPGSLTESVSRHGVQKPVDLNFVPAAYPEEASDDEVDSRGFFRAPAISNGYHRVAAAAASDPDQLVPVRHAEGLWD